MILLIRIKKEDFYKPSNLYTKTRIIYAIKRIIGHTQKNNRESL